MHYDVTIGIPVYKAGDYIRQSLLSALAQTYPSIEFLLVDDAGGDGSMDVVSQLQRTHQRGADIHVIVHDTNQGVAASRNDIIRTALGTYLYFMDADDLIEPQTIAHLMELLKRHDAEAAFGSYERVDTSGHSTVYAYPDVAFHHADELAAFAYRSYGGFQASSCNYLVSLSVLRQHGLRFVDSDFWEDMVFTLELVTVLGKAVLSSSVTYHYLCHEHSLSNFQYRSQVPKSEILRNVATIDHLKAGCARLRDKPYYPSRCYVVVMTDFYIVCNVLKKRRQIVPSVSDGELVGFLRHPATLGQICRFRQRRLSNLFLYVLGRLPSAVSISVISFIGRKKGII